MNRDFDHLLADHLLARERATRARKEVRRDPASRSARAARSRDDGSPGGAGRSRRRAPRGVVQVGVLLLGLPA